MRLPEPVGSKRIAREPFGTSLARTFHVLLVTGGSGTLGRALSRACEARGVAFRATTHAELDVTDEAAVERALDETNARAVVNASGYVRVDDAERDEAACIRANAHATAVLARACARRGKKLLVFSSDLVFGGDKRAPYVERDPTDPRSVYGRSKVLAEREALSTCPDAIVVRTSAFFGPWDEANFVTRALRALSRGETVKASTCVVSPTYVVDLAEASLDLLASSERGVFHLANRGAISWVDLARLAARVTGIHSGRVEPCTGDELGWTAARPAYSALATERGERLASLEDALARYARA